MVLVGHGESFATIILQQITAKPNASAVLYASTAAVAFILASLSYHPQWKKNGYLPGFCSALSCVLMNNYVRSAHHEEGLPFGLCILVRTACLSCATAALGKFRREPVQFIPETMDLKTRVGIRAAAGVVCTMSLFLAFSCAPVLQCLAVYYSNSVFSAAIAYFFLKEKLSFDELGAMCVGVIAVLVILRSSSVPGTPTDINDRPLLGLTFALIAALAEAVAGVANRSLRKRVHHLSLMLAQAVLGVVLSVGLSLRFPEYFLVPSMPLHPSQSRVLAGVVMSSFMVQLTTSQAYMLEKTGPLQVFMNAAVVAPQLILDTVLGLGHNAMTWLGLALLGIYLSLSWRAQQHKDDV